MPSLKHIALAGLFLLMLAACQTKLTQFVIDYSAPLDKPVEFGNFASFSTPEMKTDCRVRFEKNSTKRSKVRKIHLKNISFSSPGESSDPEREKAFISQLKHIYISSPSYPEHKVLFRKLDVQREGNDIVAELKGSDDDLIDFIKQDRFSMRFEFDRTGGLAPGQEMQVAIGFFVEGELIKTILYQKILV